MDLSGINLSDNALYLFCDEDISEMRPSSTFAQRLKRRSGLVVHAWYF